MPTAAAVMMMVVSQQRVRARRRPEPQRQSLEEKHDIKNTPSRHNKYVLIYKI